MVVVIVYAGVHDVLSRSRQISPVLKSTFGWQMGVVKRIVGGVRGYVEGMWMERAQRPPVCGLVGAFKEGRSGAVKGYLGWRRRVIR